MGLSADSIGSSDKVKVLFYLGSYGPERNSTSRDPSLGFFFHFMTRAMLVQPPSGPISTELLAG